MNKGSQASPNLRCLSVLPQRRPGFQSRFGFGPLAPQTSQREGDFRETSPAFHSQGGLRLSPEERRTPLLGGHTSLPGQCGRHFLLPGVRKGRGAGAGAERIGEGRRGKERGSAAGGAFPEALRRATLQARLAEASCLIGGKEQWGNNRFTE